MDDEEGNPNTLHLTTEKKKKKKKKSGKKKIHKKYSRDNAQTVDLEEIKREIEEKLKAEYEQHLHRERRRLQEEYNGRYQQTPTITATDIPICCCVENECCCTKACQCQ